MRVHAARLLNERIGWFGLSLIDLTAIGYTLVASDSLLRPFQMELLSFLIAGMVFLLLLQVRLRTRPKAIRDYLRSKLSPKVIR